MRQSVGQFTLCLILACALLASGGCAVVRVLHQNGDVSVTLSPIGAAMATDSDARAVYVTGLGIVVGPETSALGAFDIRYVRLDPSCRVVVMIDRNSEVGRLADFMRQYPGICTTDS